jgi:hypothetical protein
MTAFGWVWTRRFERPAHSSDGVFRHTGHCQALFFVFQFGRLDRQQLLLLIGMASRKIERPLAGANPLHVCQ